jgi:hypothetical protein
MHIFICLRLVEVPQLIRQDVPNATFLAKLFLTRRAYWVVAVLSVASWFGASAIQLSNVISNLAWQQMPVFSHRNWGIYRGHLNSYE